MNSLKFAAILLLLGAISLSVSNPTPTAAKKLVTVYINGFATEISTTAVDVATLLDEMGGDYAGYQINPDPNQLLTNGDTIQITDPTARQTTLAVGRNLEIARTPEPIVEPEPPKPAPAPQPVVDKQTSKVYSGLATWYRHGDGLTTASRDFPRGTKLRVVAVNSGKSVDVIVNDYGPAEWTGVALDLNSVAFERLAPLGAGKIQIKYHKL